MRPDASATPVAASAASAAGSTAFPFADFFSRGRRLEMAALLAWGLLLVGMSIRSFVKPAEHSVYPIFSHAARTWLASENPYAGDRWPELDFYRYSPTVAALLIPFGLMPDALGGTVWRLVGIGVLLWAFAWWRRRVLPGGESFSSRQNAVLWLMILPLSVASLHNGQANTLVIGLLLAGIAGAADRRWTFSAICVALACLFKVYPIAVALLLVVVYPRQFTWRFLAAMVAGLVFPFLCQSPTYVWQTYQTWIDHLWGDDRKTNPLNITYRDLWLLFRLYLPIERTTYYAIQLGTAAGAGAICLAGRIWGNSERRQLLILTLLGTTWMMLCGPATESCTFVMLAPAPAWVTFDAFNAPRSIWTRLAIVAIVPLFVARPLVALVPGCHDLSYALQPLGALLFGGLVLLAQVPQMFAKARSKESDQKRLSLAA